MIGFAELEPFLDRKRQELLSALKEFTNDEAASLREDAGGWTPRDIVEHLAKVEQSVIDCLQTLVNSAPALPSEPPGDKIVDITELFRETRTSRYEEKDASRVGAVRSHSI